MGARAPHKVHVHIGAQRGPRWGSLGTRRGKAPPRFLRDFKQGRAGSGDHRSHDRPCRSSLYLLVAAAPSRAATRWSRRPQGGPWPSERSEPKLVGRPGLASSPRPPVTHLWWGTYGGRPRVHEGSKSSCTWGRGPQEPEPSQ